MVIPPVPKLAPGIQVHDLNALFPRLTVQFQNDCGQPAVRRQLERIRYAPQPDDPLPQPIDLGQDQGERFVSRHVDELGKRTAVRREPDAGREPGARVEIGTVSERPGEYRPAGGEVYQASGDSALVVDQDVAAVG